MRVEAAIPALVFPIGIDLRGSVAKHGAKAVLYEDLVAKLQFNRVDPRLRYISPNAQQIGKIGYLDLSHPNSESL